MRKAHNESQFLDAIKLAIRACVYIDGLMQFETRFEKRSTRKSLELIDYVLQYAPLVFDLESLRTIEELLKSHKRIEKNTTTDLTANLRKATELLWNAHRLWDTLEKTIDLAEDNLHSVLGGEQKLWRNISESWNEMGLIQRIPKENSYRLSLTTRVTNPARGKCSACGATGTATMGTFLEEITCPRCKATVTFVLLRRREASSE